MGATGFASALESFENYPATSESLNQLAHYISCETPKPAGGHKLLAKSTGEANGTPPTLQNPRPVSVGGDAE
jgi:hypothetical protein